MTPRRWQRIDEVLRRRQRDLTLLAEDVYKPHNLSAMLRSADAVGIGTVHAVTPTGGVPTFNATSASADKWVELVAHATISEGFERVRGAGMQVLAAHFASDAADFRDVDYTRATCIVLGNEKHGVSLAAAGAADAHVVIPMLGMVSSLNVSVATAVILFEAQRQRRAAGMYDTPTLSARERNDQAIRWMHPRLAAHYDAAGQAFPTLSRDGALPSGVAGADADDDPDPG